ncbi:BEACH domain-containing protein C2 [Clarias magur]|uniref:BEACH domain-containing protein C2 n=1 Tax=Clarias magur TaxID=1594786 RepID=A0A8J4U9A2_CLAMG|nr:BEACH domain-containing protein C2 [Clarias magur]
MVLSFKLTKHLKPAGRVPTHKPSYSGVHGRYWVNFTIWLPHSKLGEETLV